MATVLDLAAAAGRKWRQLYTWRASRAEGPASLTERNTESDDSSTLGDTRTKIEASRVEDAD